MRLKKNFPTLDLNNYQKQGDLAIDMIAECLISERKQGLAVKSITIPPFYYTMLKQWVKKVYGSKIAKCAFFLDTVEIKQAEQPTDKILDIEYWKPIAEA